MKLPSFQFYPGDWMKDPALRSVGYAARGLWKDMLCLMFESVRRGYLQHENGKPITTEQLARMTGGSAEEVSRLLQELEDSGVFSRTEHGVIYSRRMVRDEQARQQQAEYGRMGGNPALKGEDKGGLKANAKANPTPSSSSSSSSAKRSVFIKPTAEEVTAYAKGIGFELDGGRFVDTYEANGWVYGKHRMPIKNWRAVVNNWKRYSAEKDVVREITSKASQGFGKGGEK